MPTVNSLAEKEDINNKIKTKEIYQKIKDLD